MSVTTFTNRGIAGAACVVVVDLAQGLPSFDVVGLADGAVREARVRVRAALTNAGFSFPEGRVVATVGPASLKQEGTGFDLPMAVAVLAASGRVDATRVANTLIVGELSLTGDVRPVRGALVAAEMAREAGKSVVLVPLENAQEALAGGITVRTVRHLRDAAAYFAGDDNAAPVASFSDNGPPDAVPDLKDIAGQPLARRLMEVAAAGAHNILFVGGPGAGKTMLARRLPGILPALTRDEALDVTRVASVAGLNIGGGLVRRRPFRAPHHSTTAAGLVGGGAPVARPGEISLAHHGVRSMPCAAA